MEGSKMYKIAKALTIALLAGAAPASALTTVYQSTPDLNDGSSQFYCSTCNESLGGLDQLAGSRFSISGYTNLSTVSIVVNNQTYWPSPITIGIYKDNGSTVGKNAFNATFSTSISTVDVGNNTSIATFSLSNLFLDSGDYLIFFSNPSWLGLSIFEKGDHANVLIRHDDLLHRAIVGDNLSAYGGTIGYQLTTRDEPLTALTVPEPANWALMIAGFGLAGATARRRRAMRPTLA
jgi:hypothetical protein